MNYLAHLFLAQPTPHSMVGNLMGDFRKYIEPDLVLPEGVLRGIKNHMEVDRFTDHDQKIYDLKNVFSRRRRRFAGIIIDVVFDYFLIKHWSCYCELPRNEFIDTAYSHLRSHAHVMPAEMARVSGLITENDWFSSYATMEGISTVLDRMSARIRFENALLGSGEEVMANYESLELTFIDFFPRLNEHIKECKIEVYK